MKKKSVFLIGLLSIFIIIPAYSTDGENLFQLFEGKSVSVYVDDVKDTTQGHELDSALVRTKLREALRNRKSIHFQIVDRPEEAQIIIKTELKEFMWTDHDPVDMLAGVGMAAMDVAIIEDYARIQADIMVTEGRSKKVLWKYSVMATITQKPMSRTESIPLVTANLAKVFIKECFSRKSRR